MRKTLGVLGALLGGMFVLIGVVLLSMFAKFDATLLIAGVVGLVVGVALFSLVRVGRTWPARVGLLVLAGITLAACQTAPQWMPYLRAAYEPAPVDAPEPVTPPGEGPSEKTTAAAATRKKAGGGQPAEAAKKNLTAQEFVSQHWEPAVRAIAAKRGYTCTFQKREWCKGVIGDYRMIDETISMKVRHEPFSVYLHFEPPKQGTEAIYVAGKNDGNVIAHSTVLPGSLLGTIRVPPDDPKVMADNRYPITNIGMKNLLRVIEERGQPKDKRLADKAGEFSATIVEERQVDGRPCKVVELIHSKPSEEIPFASGRLYFDQEWHVPVGAETFELVNGKVQLVEYYRYTNIQFDPGLKDIDFDPLNPNYGYSK